MLKQFSLTTLGLIAVVGGLVFVKVTQFKVMGAVMASQVMPPTVVTATTAKQETWENHLSATGSIAAVQGVTVGSEVAGKVAKIAFESGQHVKKNDLLIQLDTSTEEAQLQAAEADAQLAKANLQRARELRSSNTNSPAELDAADAQAKKAQAQVENLRALIAKKTIRAPFAGRLGLRLVNLGQIIKEGEPITTLETLDPIYANFSLPQQNVPDATPGSVVRVTTDAAEGKTFEGKITAANPDVDQVTRSIRVQATLQNPEEKLRPGMFASVQLVLPTSTTVLAIPVTAVMNAPYGDSVFIVDQKKDDKTGQTQQVLRQQFVRLGTARGDFVAVVEGLKPGEMVVTSGAFKLQPGMPVTIDNTLAPPASLNPKPNDS